MRATVNLNPPVKDARHASEFVKLLTSHQQHLYLYVLRFLLHPGDADEVLQETNVVLWSKADEFQLGSSFSAWAERVAFFEVLSFRKRKARSRVIFSDELLETFAQESEAEDDQATYRMALSSCLDELLERDRDLVARRYAAGASVQEVADQVRRPLTSIYRSLERIHMVLLNCVRRKTARGENS